MTYKLEGFEELRTDDKKLIEEMLSFLENYEVKKIQNRDWDSDVSKETSFRVEFYEKERITHMVILRSEEHTSELQSRGHLVCRLLLEKKKVHINDRK